MNLYKTLDIIMYRHGIQLQNYYDVPYFRFHYMIKNIMNEISEEEKRRERDENMRRMEERRQRNKYKYNMKQPRIR